MSAKDCPAEHPVTRGRCQLAEGHAEEHVFPIDDAFIRALDDGLLMIGRPTKRRRIAPDRAVITVQDLGRLDPGGWGLARAIYDQPFRVVGARVTATIVPSRIERLARRLPGVGRLLDLIFRDRAVDRILATTRLKVSGVAVGNIDRPLNKIDELPVVAPGTEFTVRVTNTGDRALCARVIVEGSIL